MRSIIKHERRYEAFSIFLIFPLVAMRSFVAHCPELLTEDVIRRLMTPIECAMTMMSQ